MRLVIYNRLRPGVAHICQATKAGSSYQHKTLCGRRWPGVLGQLTIFSDELHLCWVCQKVVIARENQPKRSKKDG